MDLLTGPTTNGEDLHMKTIKKIKNNLGKVAGSALLVGATVAAGGAAVAQDSGSSGDLGDYPAPFVNEDGEVDTSVVVGETAEDGNPVSTLDVVSGIEIAGSLGNAAFVESEESVDVSGAVASWSAENGVTLNRQNTNLFLDDAANSGITSFDEGEIDSYEPVEVTTDSGEDVELEFSSEMGSQTQEFSAVGDLDDPVLHVTVPYGNSVEAGSSGNYLFQSTVDFDSTMSFGDTETNEVLEDGDTVTLFGNEYTYSGDSTDTELTLYGNSESFDVETGSEETVDVDGEEQTFEVVNVPETGDSTIRVNGQLESVSETDEVQVNGQDVRIRNIYSTGPDGQGIIQFAIGSEEVIIDASSGDVEVDGDEVDGVDVQVDNGDSDFVDVDSLHFAFGAADSDSNYVSAGESYEDPLFGQEFHYGGLSPNAAEDSAETITVEAQEDETGDVTFTADGEETTVTISEEGSFGDQDGTISQYEGQLIGEEDRVVLNANEEAGFYEVTDISATDLNDGSAGDEGDLSVTVENVVTGESATVEDEDVTFDNNDDHTLDGESVEGMDFDVTFDTNNADPRVSFERSVDEGTTQIFPNVYTETDGALAFVDGTSTVQLDDALGDVTDSSFARDLDSTVDPDASGTTADNVAVEVLDAEGSDVSTGTIYLYDSSGSVIDSFSNTGGVATTTGATSDVAAAGLQGYEGQVDIHVDADETASAGSVDGGSTGVVDAHEDRVAEMPSGIASSDADVTWSFTSSGDDYVDVTADVPGFVQYTPVVNTEDELEIQEASSQHSALFAQPEDENDDENAYLFGVDSSDSGNGDVTEVYTGTEYRADLDSEDNVNVGYDIYGGYAELDTDDDESEVFTLNMPAAQSTVGMALTGPEGSLSAEGGGSGSVTSMMPTYEYADGVLDSDSNVGQVQNSDNLILVGGPSVNSLVAELADEGETWTADEYTEGEGLIQHVPNAFSEGQDAVIVAGYAGEDTRAAGEFLADYRNNEGALEGNQQVTISTESGQVVN